ncbi:MAG: hypothetical protein V4736_11865 [Bdellovibrionota bacterium]
MNYDELIRIAKENAAVYMGQPTLAHDEELQLLSCGYSVLFLTACAGKTTRDLGEAHEFIAKCYEKIGNEDFPLRHRQTAQSYFWE